MRLNSVALLILLLPLSAFAQKINYFLSASGNDSNDGLTKQTAWQSIDQLNKVNFKPGDSIFFEGGVQYKGSIRLTSHDSGLPALPVTITSYGKEKAVIDAGDSTGLLAINTSYIKIASLKFVGNGVNKNAGSGIHFYSIDSVTSPSNVEITDCEVKGFRAHGIVFQANENPVYKGYHQVRITHCNATENGEGGIASYGSHQGFQHRDFYIAYCKAFRNHGNPAKTENHSGNGIVMGMVDGLLLEYCEAFENGAHNRCIAGGPVGIWVWMSKNAIVQYNSSHDNYAGATKDGGGFDIDGGASNCILQYNYSYNNEGAGYLLAEYGAIFPFTNNVVRFNYSINDGRKNSYGAISIWGAHQDYQVTNTYIYNNTIFVDDKNVIDGKPAGITLLGKHFTNVVVANNIIATNGNVNLVNADTPVDTASFLLLHNNYYSYTNDYFFQWGPQRVSSLQAWFKANPNQEHWNGKPMLLNMDPQFKSLKGKRIQETSKTGLDYQHKGLIVSETSPLRKALFPLRNFFKILSNTQDYDHNTIPGDGQVMPGAAIR